MTAEGQLFKTPTLDGHLLARATAELERELSALNAAGRVGEEPEAVAALAAELEERLRVTDAPVIDDGGLAFENHDNRRVLVHLPISGDFALLAYQVRGMPQPTLVGALSADLPGRRLTIGYEVKPGPQAWDAGLDGDLAMLRAYMGALAGAVAQFNQQLAQLVDAKINETLLYNRVRREIAEKMVRRGFRELPPS